MAEQLTLGLYPEGGEPAPARPTRIKVRYRGATWWLDDPPERHPDCFDLVKLVRYHRGERGQLVERWANGNDINPEEPCALPPRDGEPCGHPGCLSHVSHPCEGCGRISGRRVR